MNFLSRAWAQSAATPAAPGGNAFGMFMPLIVVFVIFYFLIFRPQQKQQKTRQQMLANLKRGDEAITTGGIFGKITDVQDAFVMLQVSSNVTLKVERSQISALAVEPAKAS